MSLFQVIWKIEENRRKRNPAQFYQLKTMIINPLVCFLTDLFLFVHSTVVDICDYKYTCKILKDLILRPGVVGQKLVVIRHDNADDKITGKDKIPLASSAQASFSLQQEMWFLTWNKIVKGWQANSRKIFQLLPQQVTRAV